VYVRNVLSVIQAKFWPKNALSHDNEEGASASVASNQGEQRSSMSTHVDTHNYHLNSY
jgi:hypothetical protein